MQTVSVVGFAIATCLAFAAGVTGIALDDEKAAELSFGEFEAQAREGTVLLELYAGWCGVCQRFAPTFDQVATDLHALGVKTVKVDADRYKVMIARFKVTGYPAFYLIEDGEVYFFAGDRTQEALKDFAIHKRHASKMSQGPLGPLSPFWRIIGQIFTSTNHVIDSLRARKLSTGALITLGVLSVLFALSACAILIALLTKPKVD